MNESGIRSPRQQSSDDDWRVGSDIGGTFTDIAWIDKTGVLHTAKVPSTPANYGQGVATGLNQLAIQHELAHSQLTEMVHGCTIATNAILEGKGARTALVTTAGFRDVLELRRIRVPRLYEPLYVKPAPLAPRNLRFEVRERIDANGDVVQAINDSDLHEIAHKIRQAGVQAVAVCFLHSYRNPEHERRAGQLLGQLLPDLFITLSVDVLPQIREYERTSTTVINAYVGPTVKHYLNAMREELDKTGTTAKLMMMQSSGGTVSARSVLEKPAQIVECGPAAGVVGAAWLCECLGINSAITFDMGGTTAKASMIEDGQLNYADNYEVGASMSAAGAVAGGAGYALKLPVIDISEVGAGGGSIVRIDLGGAIRVGPDSAGAAPGPACYNQGGIDATVTDANVVSGFLNQQGLAGGTVPIEAALSHHAIEQAVAKPMGLSAHEAAFGVHQVANATMVRAIKAVTTYRGRDPRDFAIIAFGGNGGVHGAGVARALEVRRLIVPPAAGVFSAVGLLVAERSVTLGSAFPTALNTIDPQAVEDRISSLRTDCERLLESNGADTQVGVSVEMRYVGQAFELTIALPKDDQAKAQPKIDLSEPARARLREAFDLEHERRFGHRFDASSQVEIVSLQVRATITDGQRPNSLKMQTEPALTTSRQVYFGNPYGLMKTPVLTRQQLDQTARPGPFIIDEYEGTTVVPPDAKAHRDAFDNIVIDLIYQD